MRIIVFVAALLAGGCMAQAQELTDFNKLIAPDAKVSKLAGDLKFCEGPVWTDADGGYLVFSDIPASRLMKWDGKALTTFREDSHETNGNTRDREGRLISCEHSSRCVTRMEMTPVGQRVVKVLVHTYGGKSFNSPNDCVVKSDGSIWFTDPTYGIPKGEKKELDGQFVFRFDMTLFGHGFGGGEPLTKVATDFDQPNGLCFSPDEKKLYIADSGKPHHIRVFDVQPDHTLKGGDVLCVIDNGVPDGIRCDERGNIWSSAGDGVQIFSPDGKLIGRIAVPESPANLCFGGADGKMLFITARTSLYSIPTLVTGAARPTR